MEYDKAQRLIEKWPKTIITQTLEIFLKGYVNLFKMVELDEELK